MINLPEKYLENMKIILEEEFQNYIDSFNNLPSQALRINTNKISVIDYLHINPFRLKKVPWTNDGFYFETNDLPSKHPYYFAGLYYIQEPSAMFPGEVLPIEKDDVVLDVCAAPGGKSSKLANKLNNSGILFANDISVSRNQITLKVLENEGFSNFVILAEDIKKLKMNNLSFDKILVDAPCSGEGMFRKDKTLIKNWHQDINDYYANIQKEILSDAIDLLKDGGKLVYSTCTFSVKENEEVIEYILDKYSNIKVLPIKKYDNFVSGKTKRTKDTVRLYPHKVNGEGHYVALLEKEGILKKDKISINNNLINLPFIKDLNIEFNKDQLVMRDNKIYYEPVTNLNLKGLRILRSGLYIGEISHNKFMPSQALASFVKYKEYQKTLNFHLEDPRVIKYLKGETLDVKQMHQDGLLLVCVDKFPLGFGIINKGILKNKYPINYRYK